MDETLVEILLYILLIVETFLMAFGFVIFQSFLQEMRKNHDDHLRINDYLDRLMAEARKNEVNARERDEQPPDDKGKMYYNRDGKASYLAYNENRKLREQDKSALSEIEEFEREQI